MNKPALSFFCFALLCSAACTRPQDNTPPKFRRQANIKKYVQKARELSRRGQQRKEPLPVPALADTALVKNNPLPPDIEGLINSFERNRQIIQRRLMQTYAEDAASRLSVLGEHYRSLAVNAAREAQSPSALAEALRNIRQEQNNDWDKFIAAQEAYTRFKPGDTLVQGVRRRMEKKNREFLDRLSFYYGQEAVVKCRPVLNEALAQFAQALQQAPTEEDLSSRLQQIGTEMTGKITDVLAKYSDPVGVTPEETIAQIRSGGILAQQVLEANIDALYGKEAVLQARKAFRNTMLGVSSVLRGNARVSDKKASLERLNGLYRQEILACQKRWNEKLQQNRAGNPPYLYTSRP